MLSSALHWFLFEMNKQKFEVFSHGSLPFQDIPYGPKYCNILLCALSCLLVRVQVGVYAV